MTPFQFKVDPACAEIGFQNAITVAVSALAFVAKQ